MKKFIGREKELQKLESEFARESSFVVIYGRRRVGKTTLIKEFIRGKEALYFLATEEVESQNIKRMAEVFFKHTEQAYLKEASFQEWETLFKTLVAYKPDSKKIIIIDEFQYLAKGNQAFPSIFQRIWDEILKDQNVMVILCGSLISMMQHHALSYQSPLYGRRTAQIKLSPLKFSEICNYYPEKKFEDLVEIYAVTGGVPKYFDFFDNTETLFDNIHREVLQRDGFLYEEPIFLLEKEVGEVVSYFSIIKQIALGNHKISQMAGALGMKTNALSPYLKTLMDLDLLEKRVPVTEKQPEKSRKGLFYIKDHFIEFWFKFVFPYKGELEMDNLNYVMDKIKQRFIEGHVSYIFEGLCQEQLSNLCLSGKISMTPERIGSYWSSDIEIGVMAIDESNKKAILGECKYHKQVVDADVFFELKAKALKIKELHGYNISYALFSKSGFSQRLMDLAKAQGDIFLVNQMMLI